MTGSNSGHDEGEGNGWSQNLGLNKGKPSRRSASPEEACQHKKMAQKVVATWRIIEQNTNASSDCGGDDTSGGSWSITSREVVTLLPV